jgi:hypothetical protein
MSIMTRSAIILGAGRSGTSLLAGLFQSAGYFSGDNLWPGTVSNPLGYFEDAEINAINEGLLGKVMPWRPRGILGAGLPVLRDRPRWSQRWLATLPEGIDISSSRKLDRRISRQTSRQPYLFKDPRFSYTLPAWVPHLAPGTAFICVFREPQRTVNSIMRNVRDERYLRDLTMTTERACRYWEAVYRSVLNRRQAIGGCWLFLHYDELLTGRAIPVLESCLGAPANRTMLQPSLNRSAAHGSTTPAADELYGVLSGLAEQKYT